jgi:hypothetical protein
MTESKSPYTVWTAEKLASNWKSYELVSEFGGVDVLLKAAGVPNVPASVTVLSSEADAFKFCDALPLPSSETKQSQSPRFLLVVRTTKQADSWQDPEYFALSAAAIAGLTKHAPDRWMLCVCVDLELISAQKWKLDQHALQWLKSSGLPCNLLAVDVQADLPGDLDLPAFDQKVCALSSFCCYCLSAPGLFAATLPPLHVRQISAQEGGRPL